MIGNGIGEIPPINVLYTYSTNKEWSNIATTSFSKHVDEAYPIVKLSDDDQGGYNVIPIHTIIRMSLIETNEWVMSEVCHIYVIDNYGDANISCGTSWIGRALQFYLIILLVINTKYQEK